MAIHVTQSVPALRYKFHSLTPALGITSVAKKLAVSAQGGGFNYVRIDSNDNSVSTILGIPRRRLLNIGVDRLLVTTSDSEQVLRSLKTILKNPQSPELYQILAKAGLFAWNSRSAFECVRVLAEKELPEAVVRELLYSHDSKIRFAAFNTLRGKITNDDMLKMIDSGHGDLKQMALDLPESRTNRFYLMLYKSLGAENFLNLAIRHDRYICKVTLLSKLDDCNYSGGEYLAAILNKHFAGEGDALSAVRRYKERAADHEREERVAYEARQEQLRLETEASPAQTQPDPEPEYNPCSDCGLCGMGCGH